MVNIVENFPNRFIECGCLSPHEYYKMNEKLIGQSLFEKTQFFYLITKKLSNFNKIVW